VRVCEAGEICEQKKETILPSGKENNNFVGLEHINSGETRLKRYVPDTNVKSSNFRNK